MIFWDAKQVRPTLEAACRGHGVILRQMGVMRHVSQMSRRRNRQQHTTLPAKLNRFRANKGYTCTIFRVLHCITLSLLCLVTRAHSQGTILTKLTYRQGLCYNSAGSSHTWIQICFRRLPQRWTTVPQRICPHVGRTTEAQPPTFYVEVNTKDTDSRRPICPGSLPFCLTWNQTHKVLIPTSLRCTVGPCCNN